jgi:hypothetical protein
MRNQIQTVAMALAVGFGTGVAPLATVASDSIEGTLNAIVIDYPAEDGDATAHDHDGAAAQSGEMPELGRAEYVYRLQRDDGTEVRLQGEEALAPYTTGDRLSVQGRMVSAAGSDGPNRMAVRSVEPLADADGDVARQGTAADHGEDGITERRVLGIVVDFKGSETDTSLDEARKALFDASDSSDALYRMASGANADIGAQLGFFPPEGGGPEVVHVDVDITPNGCDYNGWASAADEAAKSQGIDFSNHQQTTYFLPWVPTSDCRWAGIANLGCRGSCQAWVRGMNHHTTAHELGHNLGLHHSREDPGREYGEYTVMGYRFGYINPPHRDYLGWYDDHPEGMRVVEAGEETVTITGISGLNSNWGDPHPHAVKVPIGDSGHAYYAYQAEADPLGDDRYDPVADNEVVITRTDPDRGPRGSMQYAILGLGEFYKDSDHDIRFTVDSKSASSATLRVENGDELVADDVAWTMAPGEAHEGTLDASKPNGKEPSFLKEGRADQGKARVDSEGSFTYKANADAKGSDTFTFQASAASQTDKGTAEISFNQTPQVESLELTVDAGGSVEDTLPASDAESAIEDVALTITEQPQKGTIKGPKDDGSFTYTADEGESGTDTFRYTAGDAYSESKPAEGTVTIQDDNGDDSGSGGSDGSDSGGSGDGSSGGGDSGGGGGGAVGWLSLLALLGGMLVASRRRLVTLFGGTHA